MAKLICLPGGDESKPIEVEPPPWRRKDPIENYGGVWANHWPSDILMLIEE